MLEIRTDISSLTKRQREMLTGFILTFDLPEHEQLMFKTLGEHVQDGLDACKRVADTTKNAEFMEVTDGLPRFADVAERLGLVSEDEKPKLFDAAAAFAAPPPPPPPVPISQTGPHLVVGEQPAIAVDKSGAVWDERYHASSKALTADGLWRKRRGVADASPPPPQPAPGAPPPPPPAGSDPRLALYVSLVRETAAAVASKLATHEEFKAIAASHGVASIPLIANALDKAEVITEECRTLIASRTPSA